MLSLEPYRKQAKQILRWHRDRYHSVAVEIRAFLPRFAALNDKAILDSPFRLADAQELVARRNGHAGWHLLKEALQTMKPSLFIDPVPFPQLNGCEAQLYVRDIARSCAYYHVKLGFELVLSHGEPAFFALLQRDHVRLSLRHVDEPVFMVMCERDYNCCPQVSRLMHPA
jgi:hypothetical protein